MQSKWSYTQEGKNPHTKSMFRELSTVQLASHHAKKDKLRSQRAHIHTHTHEHMCCLPNLLFKC